MNKETESDVSTAMKLAITSLNVQNQDVVQIMYSPEWVNMYYVPIAYCSIINNKLITVIISRKRKAALAQGQARL